MVERIESILKSGDTHGIKAKIIIKKAELLGLKLSSNGTNRHKLRVIKAQLKNK